MTAFDDAFNVDFVIGPRVDPQQTRISLLYNDVSVHSLGQASHRYLVPDVQTCSCSLCVSEILISISLNLIYKKERKKSRLSQRANNVHIRKS